MNKEQLEGLRDRINTVKSQKAMLSQVIENKKKERSLLADELKEEGIDVSGDLIKTREELEIKLKETTDELLVELSEWETRLNEIQKGLV